MKDMFDQETGKPEPNHKAAVAYWSSQPATVDGMLGGYGTGRVPRLDIAHSKLFVNQMVNAGQLRVSCCLGSGNKGIKSNVNTKDVMVNGTKRRKLSLDRDDTEGTSPDRATAGSADPASTESINSVEQDARGEAAAETGQTGETETRQTGETEQTETEQTETGQTDQTDKVYTLDCGAGIGRVTKDLLLSFSDVVEAVEPCGPFIETFRTRDDLKGYRESGALGTLHTCGIESFTPSRRKYRIIWNQWCCGQVNDSDLLRFLKSCKTGLKDKHSAIFVKENVAPTQDVFDEQDNSWTRTELHFLDLFKAANLKVVKSSWQHGFPKELFPVKLWALK